MHTYNDDKHMLLVEIPVFNNSETSRKAEKLLWCISSKNIKVQQGEELAHIIAEDFLEKIQRLTVAQLILFFNFFLTTLHPLKLTQKVTFFLNKKNTYS